MFAELVFLYALQTNESLYIGEVNAPHRETGIQLRVHKPLPYNSYFELKPYIWGGDGDIADAGGVIAKVGVWIKDRVSITFIHKSEHNFDRGPGQRFDGEFISTDLIELRWKLN